MTVNSGGSAAAFYIAQRSLFTGGVGTNTATGTLNINGGSLTVNNAIVGNGGTANAASTSNLNLTPSLTARLSPLPKATSSRFNTTVGAETTSC